MRIHYVTGSRADFGLMLPCLRALDEADDFEVELVVTGQHLLTKYGMTIRDITNSGLRVAKCIKVELSGDQGAEMAMALANELAGLTELWRNDRPDLVMLLGDRGEMLAGALAALHQGIPIVHVGGGERSGTLDENFRHAITKLSHVHLCSTGKSAARIARMGENSDNIHVIGAPGLVGISECAKVGIDFERDFGLISDKPVALVIFHPVVQQAAEAPAQIAALVNELRFAGYAQLILRPNSDAGGAGIERWLDGLESNAEIVIVDHLSRERFLSAMRAAELIAGNSSSGIIESLSVGTRCLNVGTRQIGRERNSNTVDCPEVDELSIRRALEKVRMVDKGERNIYGPGDADKRMLSVLRSTKFNTQMLSKVNSY